MEYTPDPDGPQIDKSVWAKSHLQWDCYHCYFADPKSLGLKPCCTFPSKMRMGIGATKCFNHKLGTPRVPIPH